MKYATLIWLSWLSLSFVWADFEPVAFADGLQLSPKTQLRAVQNRLRPKRIALLIGVSRYTHAHWSDLRYPKTDVAKMKRFLLKQGRFDEIVTLVQPKQTTQKGLREGLRWLRQRNRSTQDTLLVYVSGHGTIAQSRPGKPLERYLVATDSTQKVPQSSIALAEIQQLLQTLPARRKVIVLATCYIGQVRAKKKHKAALKGLNSGTKGQYNLGWVSRSMLVLSAAGYMQPAYELNAVQGDVYTHFLLKCAQDILKTKKWVTMTMAHHCATPRTYRFIQKKLGRQQTPSIESKIMGKDRLLFGGMLPTTRLSQRKRRKDGWIQLARSQYKKVQFRPRGSKGAGRVQSVATNTQTGTMVLRLQPGPYHIRLQTPTGEWLDRYIVVLPGETYDLASPTRDPARGQQDSSHSILPPIRSNDALRRAIQYFEASPNSFSLEWGPDLEFGARWQFVFKMGISTPYAGGGIVFGGGNVHANSGHKTNEALIRFGLHGNVGYPLRLNRWDFFLYLHLETSLWQSYEDKAHEMVFLFAYGPQLRIRLWLHEKFAFRLNAGVLFSLSPDRAKSQQILPEYDWTHRAHLSFSFGIDFGFGTME